MLNLVSRVKRSGVGMGNIGVWRSKLGVGVDEIFVWLTFVGFLGFYDGFSCFPLNEVPIYVGKHMLKLDKAFTVKMTSCIDQ